MLGRHRRSRRRSTRCTDFCIDLRDDLLARAKELAAKERTSLTKIIEEGLVLRLCRQRAFRGRLKERPRSAGEAVCATESTPRGTVRSSSQTPDVSALIRPFAAHLVTFDRDFQPVLPSRDLTAPES